ncbi:hypothetical protein [Pseudomonas sp. GM30]|uniref:hypothetical protein n=1 Tax=Pseudomonas sp. GM30 TaxID=1144328 RepID=UPI0002702534|nr:hypothetical protein [Pseudomonas sp. GM30]EUB83945.1 hypothetical protein PMI25_001878 [Pseudomonas sp. GM30]
MTDYNEYFDEVIQAHLLIERWFAVEQDPAELAHLLGRFAADFSMVTPLGRTLDIEALRALFQAAGGNKPGFRIELSELRGIALHAHGATLSYREQQSDASGLYTDRRSTVVFAKTEAERVLWRHLQETFCAE